MAERPGNVRYTPTHEWIRLEKELAFVGITDFAVEHLGDLVFVDLPEVGRTLSAGEAACEVESVKAVSEVYAPAAGEVVEVNAGLAQDQTPLATDPYGEGWLFKLRLASPAPSALLDRDAYDAHLMADES